MKAGTSTHYGGIDMALENREVFLRKDNFILRRIHDSYFLIDITDNYMNDKCVLFEINEIGAFIWRLINGKSSLGAIAQELFDAIADDVAFQDIVSDTSHFISSLLRNGLIKRI